MLRYQPRGGFVGYILSDTGVYNKYARCLRSISIFTLINWGTVHRYFIPSMISFFFSLFSPLFLLTLTFRFLHFSFLSTIWLYFSFHIGQEDSGDFSYFCFPNFAHLPISLSLPPPPANLPLLFP